MTGLYRVDTDPWQPMEVSTSRQTVDGVDAATLPTIFTIFDRLGLNLVPQKRTVVTYLIAHVERPLEN